MPLPLANKLALVTGASGGIGSAIACRLAEDGAAVLVHYASGRESAERVVREIQTAGREAEAIHADLGRADGPAALIAQIDPAFGGRFAGLLDVLVNNAGALEFGPSRKRPTRNSTASSSSTCAPSSNSRARPPAA